MKQTIILNQNRDFQTLYKRGISFVTPFVVIYMRPNRFGVHRLGITAGKRVGNAVQNGSFDRRIGNWKPSCRPIWISSLLPGHGFAT